MSDPIRTSDSSHMQFGLIGTIKSTIQLPLWFRAAAINYVYDDCSNPKLVEDPKTI